MRTLAALALSALLASPARAAVIKCAPWAVLKNFLNSKHHEEPVAQGISSSGSVLHLWASPSGTTWTITATHPNGTSCILSDGRGLALGKFPIEEAGS